MTQKIVSKKKLPVKWVKTEGLAVPLRSRPAALKRPPANHTIILLSDTGTLAAHSKPRAIES